MFDSIKNALDGSGVNIVDGGVFVISESDTTSATGLVSHFISHGISNHHHVCFVSLQHTWGHFCNIGNKLGVNLRQNTAEGKVKVIEALKLLSEIFDDGVEHADHPFNFILEGSEHPLRNLYNEIKKTVQPWKDKNEYFLLIIDSVSFFLNLGVQIREIDIFIRYCRNLTVNPDIPHKQFGAVFFVTKSSDKDEDATYILKKITHSSLVHMSLEGLSTGLSREVHGNLNITTFNRNLPHVCLPEVQLFQYKMEDKNMKLFAPGTSSGVL